MLRVIFGLRDERTLRKVDMPMIRDLVGSSIGEPNTRLVFALFLALTDTVAVRVDAIPVRSLVHSVISFPTFQSTTIQNFWRL